MIEENNDKKERRSIRLFGILLPNLPSFIFRYGGLFLRFKRDAKKAGKVFKKELINQGINKQMAADLTEIYLEGSNLSKLIQVLR
jgi:hypothetical protein